MTSDHPPRQGLRSSAARVVGHLGSLARLERELARSELRHKSASMGAGAGLAVAAIALVPFAIAFGLAAAATALALVLHLWLALLIVFAALLLLVVVLAVVSRNLVRRATPLKPEQAIAEARLTGRLLRGSRAD
jgi:membrane protein implicated in regulation of membrane protease activity